MSTDHNSAQAQASKSSSPPSSESGRHVKFSNTTDDSEQHSNDGEKHTHKHYSKTHAPPPSHPSKPTKKENHVVFDEKDIERKDKHQQQQQQRHSTSDYPKTMSPTIVENPSKIKVTKEEFLTHLCLLGVLVLVFLLSVFLGGGDAPVKPYRPPLIKHTQYDIIQPALPGADGNGIIQVPVPVPVVPVQKDDAGKDIDANDKVVDVPSSPSSGNGAGCTLYLAESSIPNNSGLGIFSTKPFGENETILPHGTSFHVNGFDDLAPYAMLMKKHADYSNIKGGVGDSSNALVASRAIVEGEELFLSSDMIDTNLYRNLHPDDPTKEMYDKVDSLAQEFMDAIPEKKVEVRKKAKLYAERRVLKIEYRPLLDAAPLLQILRDTIGAYDEPLSKLFPATMMEAWSMTKAGGRAKYISNVRPIEWLAQNGVCIDGVQPFKSDIYPGQEGAVVTRKVAKGDVIITAPLYAAQLTDEYTNVNVNANESGDSKRCFALQEAGIMLCPLSFASYINSGVDQNECDGNGDKDCPNNVSNAFYQWSAFNTNNQGFDEASISDLPKRPLTGFTIDVIANRDIDEGEEVLVDYSSGEQLFKR